MSMVSQEIKDGSYTRERDNTRQEGDSKNSGTKREVGIG